MSDFLRGLAFKCNIHYERDGTKPDDVRIQNICQILGIEQSRIYEWNDVRDDVEQSPPNPIWSARFSEVDYVVCFHLSHGSNDGRVLLGKNKEESIVCEMRSEYLETLFTYEALKNKLKWVILLACRGSQDFQIVQTDGANTFEKYFLICFPTQEGFVASRNLDEPVGSIYLRFMEDALHVHWRDTGLTQILDVVNERARNENPGQRPSSKKNFAGDFYFRRNQPGHLE